MADTLGKLVVAVSVLYVWVVWHRPYSAVGTPALICMWSSSLSWVRLDLVVRNLVVACMLSFLMNEVHLDLAVHNLAEPLRMVSLGPESVAEEVMFRVRFRVGLWELDGECGGLEW